MRAYRRRQDRARFVQDEKYSAQSIEFLDFMFTFAMSLMNSLVLNCSTKASDISDMAKS